MVETNKKITTYKDSRRPRVSGKEDGDSSPKGKYRSLEKIRPSSKATPIQIQDPKLKRSSIFESDLSSKRRKQYSRDQIRNNLIASNNRSTMDFVPKDSLDLDLDLDLEANLSDDDLIIPDTVTLKQKLPTRKSEEYSELDKLVLKNSKPGVNLDKPTEKRNADAIQIVDKMLLETPIDVDEIRSKYQSMEIPDVTTSKDVLTEKVKKIWAVIPKLLKGEEEMSFFYELAKEQKDLSPFQTMRQHDKYKINWSNFVGGYYGSKCQLFISSLIISEFEKQIYETMTRNPTVAFWGVEGFSQYVLANEIIIRLAMDDYKCSFKEAATKIRKTGEYGRVITDAIDFDDEVGLITKN